MRPIAGPPRAYTPHFSWAGLYVGIHAGAGSGESYDDVEPNVRIGGQLIGAHLGFNVIPAGNLLLGLEAEMSWAGLDGMTQYIDTDLGPVTLTHDVTWIGALRGRVGWQMGRWLPYLSAGIARANSTRTTGELQIISQSHQGWTIGIGVEWAFTPDWTMRLEYRHFDFGPRTYEWGNGGPSVADFNFNSLEVGLSRKF